MQTWNWYLKIFELQINATNRKLTSQYIPKAYSFPVKYSKEIWTGGKNKCCVKTVLYNTVGSGK